MKRLIDMEPSEIDRLSADLKTSVQTIYNANRFRTNSSFAKLIRGMAIERGGILMAEVPAEKIKEVLRNSDTKL